MKGFGISYRRKTDRRVPNSSKDLGAHIDTADIDQTPRAQIQPAETFPVRLDRQVIVHAGGHVAPMRRRKDLAGSRLELENVDGVLQIRNDRWRLLRSQ